ncbi:hypothetical protein FRC0126_00416 [Corynebacterium diphtheriae]|uniref:Deoxyribose-phosphate aldolase n=1 Tax=Corynebacterium diphtheriae (strain ATCC 700971 / NCTC 13129 / Biotype gravis) TaxID=257309 RepID=Q6NJM1_CORDI|nr:hypothetical protein CIP103987_00211 [Corynebacterium diphtheriae]CAB0494404.1 hypothetical protein CIP107504_00460 [Corynebacterium diphtheriae]CAB0534341.1 hypothetical protein CIP107526_00205 [Corynebacterium diphtheriae]CAB0536142.1 hypothetical protein CIP107522_00322 [Corynebacterium diphtheriae]CAB0536387.1 hypothetical protein CIP107510_00319 [Corynebacterium diphtheriae]
MIPIVSGPEASVDKARELAAGGEGVCVPPTLLTALGQVPGPVVSWAGYPTGQHHSLIKASEARLAVQCGAGMVLVVPDPAAVVAGTSTALITELVTTREAVPHPASLALVLDTDLFAADVIARTAEHAQAAGFDAVVVKKETPQLALPTYVWDEANAGLLVR